MANTPFLDLVKPAGTDRALVSVINSNSDKIDGGVSTLSEQIANTINDFGSKTISGMNAAIDGKLSSMAVGESISFKVTLTDTDSVFTSSGAHTGIATKSADSRINAILIRSGTSTIGHYCGTKTSNGWVWKQLATADQVSNIDFAALLRFRTYDLPTNGSLELNVSGYTRAVIFTMSTSSSAFAIIMVGSYSGGSVTASKLDTGSGSSISVTSASGKITIGNSYNANVRAFALIINGDITVPT